MISIPFSVTRLLEFSAWEVRIQNPLAPADRVFRFADPHFIGRHYVIEDEPFVLGQGSGTPDDAIPAA